MTINGKGEGRSRKARAARIAFRRDALLIESDGCELHVVILDVSKDGFRLDSRCELVAGSEVRLQVGKRPPVRAEIRWVRGGEAGGVFLEPVWL